MSIKYIRKYIIFVKCGDAMYGERWCINYCVVVYEIIPK